MLKLKSLLINFLNCLFFAQRKMVADFEVGQYFDELIAVSGQGCATNPQACMDKVDGGL